MKGGAVTPTAASNDELEWIIRLIRSKLLP